MDPEQIYLQRMAELKARDLRFNKDMAALLDLLASQASQPVTALQPVVSVAILALQPPSVPPRRGFSASNCGFTAYQCGFTAYPCGFTAPQCASH